MAMERGALAELVVQFTEALNREDQASCRS